MIELVVILEADLVIVELLLSLRCIEVSKLIPKSVDVDFLLDDILILFCEFLVKLFRVFKLFRF